MKTAKNKIGKPLIKTEKKTKRDKMTLTDLCGELNNYFDVLRIYGEFEISTTA